MPSAKSLAKAAEALREAVQAATDDGRDVTLHMGTAAFIAACRQSKEAIAAALDEERTKGEKLVAAAQQAAVEIGEAAWRKREEERARAEAVVKAAAEIREDHRLDCECGSAENSHAPCYWTTFDSAFAEWRKEAR